MKEAEKNYALPIDDRLFDRLIASNVGRPDLMKGVIQYPWPGV